MRSMCFLSTLPLNIMTAHSFTAASILTTVLPLFVLCMAKSHAISTAMANPQELLMDAVATCDEYLLQQYSPTVDGLQKHFQH